MDFSIEGGSFNAEKSVYHWPSKYTKRKKHDEEEKKLSLHL